MIAHRQALFEVRPSAAIPTQPPASGLYLGREMLQVGTRISMTPCTCDTRGRVMTDLVITLLDKLVSALQVPDCIKI